MFFRARGAMSGNAANDRDQSSPLEKRTAKRLGGQTLYMLAGNFFTLAVGLPLQVFVSRILGASGLGVFGLMEAGVGLVTPFLSFGAPQAALRFLPAHVERGEYGAARRLVRKGAIFLIASSGTACVVAAACIPLITQYWPSTAEHQGAMLLMTLMIPLSTLIYFLQQSLRGFQEIRYMVLGSSVVQLSVKAALVVGAFAVGYRVEGYAFATVAATAVSVLWMSFGLRRRMDAFPVRGVEQAGDPAEWRQYAGIVYLSTLLNLILARGNLDRFLLGYFAGPAAVGILIVVRQLQIMPVTFNNMLLTVGAPMASAAHARNDAAERQHIYTLMTDWVVRASLPLILFFLIFDYPLLALFGPEFAAGGVDALRILVATMAINLAAGPCGNMALMCGLERYVVKFRALSIALQAALLVLLIPRFELLGAAIAIGATYVVSAVYTVYLVRRYLDLRWWDARFGRWILPALASALTGAVIRFVGDGLPILIAGALAMYIVFALVNLAQGLHRDDKELLSHLRSRLFQRA